MNLKWLNRKSQIRTISQKTDDLWFLYFIQVFSVLKYAFILIASINYFSFVKKKNYIFFLLIWKRVQNKNVWLSNGTMIYTMDQWLWLITLKSDIQGRQSIYCYQLKTCHNRCLYVKKKYKLKMCNICYWFVN
jgi:hypothetical protein